MSCVTFHRLSLSKMDDHPSQFSTVSMSKDTQNVCRICHSEEESDSSFISPCYCSGSLRFVHSSCLAEWIKSSEKVSCEICSFDFIIHRKLKPFSQWEKPNITGKQKFKAALYMLYHVMMIATFALYVFYLVEVKDEDFTWEDWMYLLLICGILVGEIIAIFFHCEHLLLFFRRWRDLNKVISVQNAPKRGNSVQQQQQIRMSIVPVSSGVTGSSSHTLHSLNMLLNSTHSDNDDTPTSMQSSQV